MDAMLEHGCHKAVANALGVSRSTVEHHCYRAGIRMQIQGRNITKYLLWDRWRSLTREDQA
jgi:FixJ family two-component response regulator